MSMQGKVILVTGVGQGIGYGIAELLVAEGARVVGVDINPESEQSFNNLVRSHSAVGQFYQGDVSRARDVERIVQGTIAAYGRLDVLVNNAGMSISKPVEVLAEDEWDRVIAVNLKAHYLFAHYAIPQMRKQLAGVIINLSSVLGFAALPENAAYCAAKAGVIGFTKSLALEVARDNIRVNAVVPGSIDTPMLWEGLSEAERIQIEPEVTNCEPIGRLGTPLDIAKAIRFLASDDSTFATGAPFFIDGGLLARLATIR